MSEHRMGVGLAGCTQRDAIQQEHTCSASSLLNLALRVLEAERSSLPSFISLPAGSRALTDAGCSAG